VVHGVLIIIVQGEACKVIMSAQLEKVMTIHVVSATWKVYVQVLSVKLMQKQHSISRLCGSQDSSQDGDC